MGNTVYCSWTKQNYYQYWGPFQLTNCPLFQLTGSFLPSSRVVPPHKIYPNPLRTVPAPENLSLLHTYILTQCHLRESHLLPLSWHNSSLWLQVCFFPVPIYSYVLSHTLLLLCFLFCSVEGNYIIYPVNNTISQLCTVRKEKTVAIPREETVQGQILTVQGQSHSTEAD